MDDDWDDEAWLEAAKEAEVIERSKANVPQRPQEPTPAAGAAEEWSCPRCTLKNPIRVKICSVCDYNRESAKSAAGNSALPASQLRDSSMSSWLVQSRPQTAPPPVQTAVPKPITSTSNPTNPPRQQAAKTAAAASNYSRIPTESVQQPRSRQTLVLQNNQAGLLFAPNPLEIPEESVVMGATIDHDLAGQWIYPSNYTVRSYQQSIARAALFQNTLVCLPTGLGKTLIAAVVMYNFYRWFPNGKIVFMAPTKPLVSQQIQACHDVMPIPQTDMAELQGNVPPVRRKQLWATKRVFFCTPQSLQNDIERGNCDVGSFVCVVVDEAHRATGNYAYVVVVKAIAAKISGFRVLALSATPGSKFDVIQDVLTNLRISHIECKSGDDPDVRKYMHTRQEEIIICKMNQEVTTIKSQFLKLFNPVLHRLCTSQVFLYRDATKVTRWNIMKARDLMRANPQGNRPYRTVEADFALLSSLAHGRDVLNTHGIGNFKSYLETFRTESMSGPKKFALESPDFQELLRMVEAQTTDGRSTVNNPKLLKLREVLLEHFTRHQQGGSSTRAIVFTQRRESVAEIVQLLSSMEPLIFAKPFVGQGSSKEQKGQTQKQQQEIVAKFRQGEFNVLVATCIGEEGLDIGEVDLIVSFDMLTSPVRMIQRMGRTGRKRVGRVVLLVTEGEEEKKLERSVAAAKSVNRSLTIFKDKFKFVPSARMIPRGIVPKVTESAMVVPTFKASLIGGKKTGKKQATDQSSSWQLDEMENRELDTRFKSSSVQHRFYLSSLRLPLPLDSDSKPHHFGTSRRSRCLLQLLHRIRHGNRMTNAQFYQQFMQSSSLSEQHTISEASFNLPIETRVDSQPPERNLPEASVPEEIYASFPLSLDDDFNNAAVEHSENNHPVSTGEGRKSDDKPIEIPSSPEAVDVPPLKQPVSKSPQTKQSEISQFFRGKSPTMQSKQSQGLTSHLRELPAASSSPAKRALSLSASVSPIKQNSAPRKQSSPAKSKAQQSNAKRPMKNKLQLPASVKEASVLSMPKPRTQSVDFTLDLSLSPFEQGERVIAMLEHLSTHAISSPVPTISSAPPQVSPQIQSTPPSRRSFPRLLSPQPPETPKVVDIDTLVPPPPVPIDESSGTMKIQTPNESTIRRAEDSVATPRTPASRVSTIARVFNPPFGEDEFSPIEPKTPKTSVKKSNADSNESLDIVGDSQTPWSLESAERSAKRSIASPFEASFPTPTSNHSSQKPPIPKPRFPLNNRTPSPGIRKSVGSTEPPRKRQNTGSPDEGDFESVIRPKAKNRILDTPSPASSIAIPTPTSAPTIVANKSQKVSLTQSEVCQVCGDDESSDSDPILFCDGCNVAVHQHCYGVAFIPQDDWFCDACRGGDKPKRCVLCPVLKGALKQTLCKQWVHVKCYLWIPELVVNVENGAISLGSLETLDAERFALKCEICHSAQGYGIVQCAYKMCLRAFHVSCASSSKSYELVQREDVQDAQFVIFCPTHRTAAHVDDIREVLVSPGHASATPSSDHGRKRRRLKQRRTSPRRGKQKASKRLISHYIEMEAEADEEDDQGSEEEDDQAAQEFLSSFIDDGSQQSEMSPASMQAIYRRRASTSPMVSRYLPADGIVAACLQNGDLNQSMEMESEVLHHGFSCNECGLNPIEGARYNCQRCPNFNLCMCCYSARNEFHPKDHRFIPVDASIDGIDNPTQDDFVRGNISRQAPREPAPRATAVNVPTRSYPNAQAALQQITETSNPPDQKPQLTAEQIARMEESRRKALELKQKRMQAQIVQTAPAILREESKPNAQPPAPTPIPPSSTTSTVKTSHKNSSVLLTSNPKPSPPVESMDAPDAMPSFSLLPNIFPVVPVVHAPTLPHSIVYHPRVMASSWLVDMFAFTPLPKVADASLDCDILLSARYAIHIVKYNELQSIMSGPQCPHVQTLACFGQLTYFVEPISSISTTSNPPEFSDFAQRFPGVSMQWISSSAELLQHVLSTAKAEDAAGLGLAQYQAGKGKDRLYLDRWHFFQKVPMLSFGGQQALTNRFSNLSVHQICQMNKKFNPMHWKRMLPWISDEVARSVYQYVSQSSK